MRKKALLNLLKFGFVAGVLYYLVASDRLNFERLYLFIEHPTVLFTVLAVLILWIIPLAALRWWFLLKAIGLPVPYKRANLLTWIGNFFNVTLPGSITGDFVKGFYIIRTQEKEGKTPALATLLIDRFVGLFGLIIIAFFALLFNFSFILHHTALIPLAWMVTGLFFATLVFYTIVLFPFQESKDPFVQFLNKLPGRQITTKVYLAFKQYQHQKPTLGITLLISMVIHLSVGFLFFQIAHMVGVKDLSIATQFFIMPIGLITIAIPIAPGGIGVGHLAFGELYRYVGILEGTDIFNLYIILQLCVFLLGVIPYLLYSDEYRLPAKKDGDFSNT